MLLLAIAFAFVISACNGITTTAATTAATTTAATTAATTTAATTTAVTTAATTTAVTTATTVATTTAATTAAPTTTTLPTTLSILNDLNMGQDGIYTLSLVDEEAVVSFNKHDQNWAAFEYLVPEATDLSRFNKLVFTVRGEGSMLVVFESETEAYEVRVNLTAGNVMNQVNLRDLDTFLGELIRVRIYLAPGQANARGEVIFSQFQFDVGTAFGTVLEVEVPEAINVLTADWALDVVETYAFSRQLDGSVDVTYDKVAGQGWVWAKMTIDPDDAAGMNTMTITVEGTAGKTIMLKPNNSGAMEKTFTFEAGVPVVYTVTTSSFADLVLFAEPGVESVSGTFTIVSVELSYVAPQNSRWEDISFLTDDWVGIDDGIYTATEELDGSITIDYVHPSTAYWTAVKYIMPEFYGNHNAIRLTIQGPVGVEAFLKPNDYWAFERHIFFTGEEETFVFPMGAVTPTSFFMIIDPNHLGNLTDSVSIIAAEVIYIPVGNDVNSGWAENDAGTYAVTDQDNGHVLFEYTKGAGQGWIFARATFDELLTPGMNTMMVIIKGTPGTQVMLKPNDSGALERWVTFTNDRPVVVYISAEIFTNMLIFAEPGVESVNGSFEIYGVYLSYVQPAALERDVVVDFATGWEDNGDSVYTFVEADGMTTVTYNKVSQGWSTMIYTFTDNLALHNTLTFVVQGTATKQILIKVNNSYETWFTFDGTEQTVNITLPVGPTSVLIFAEGGVDTASGTFMIKSAEASFEPVPLSVVSGWEPNSGDSPVVYTITDNLDGTFTVDYTKTASQEWVFMINIFDTNKVIGLNTLTIVVQGTVGKTLLIKPNDSNAMEQMITFDGTEQTFTYTATGFTKLLLFAEGGTPGVTGSFDIISVDVTLVPGE